MTLDRFFTFFDKKRFTFVLKILFIFLFLVLIFNIVFTTYSRYESKGQIYAKADVALFLLDEGTTTRNIYLDGLIPRNEPFLYTINITNYDNLNNRANVDIEYSIEMTTTTNLPLTYELTRNSVDPDTNIIDYTTLITDTDVYYKKHNIPVTDVFYRGSDRLDQYTLKVYFPENYKNNATKYQGKIDLITIKVNANQLV